MIELANNAVDFYKNLKRKKPKKIVHLAPQPGKQTDFLSSSADIAIYGGTAGSGKTAGELLEAMRNVKVKNFTCVIFRRDKEQIRQAGGLWEESDHFFRKLKEDDGGDVLTPVETRLVWKSKKYNSRIKFAGMELERDKYKFQGAQIPLIMFDELTHFTYTQFDYMMSRNRLGSCKGIKPYIRATCNPDPDSWVKKFIEWWIDPKTGFPIPERSGVLRWFIKQGNKFFWGDSKEEIIKKYPKARPLSLTFISAKIEDNKILLDNDPDYLAKLESLNYVEKMQLLHGNWKIKASAGLIFKKENWIKEYLPPRFSDIVSITRYWDRASTLPSNKNPDPDFTSGTLMALLKDGSFWVLNEYSKRAGSLNIQKDIQRISKIDKEKYGDRYFICLEQEPGASGDFEVKQTTSDLAGYYVKIFKANESKKTRAMPFASQLEAGNVHILVDDFTDDFIEELNVFPDGVHDDKVDSASGAFKALSEIVLTSTKDVRSIDEIDDYESRYRD